MKEQVQQPKTRDPQKLVTGQCRAAFMAAMTNQYIRLLLEQPELPGGMNRNVLRKTIDENDRLIREVRRTVPPHNQVYLDKNLKRNKLIDMSTVVDVMARIGIEENTEAFEEFTGLVLDLLDAVFYSQKHRRAMHFGKYKALMGLISREIVADTNETQGQVKYLGKGQICIRIVPPETETTIK